MGVEEKESRLWYVRRAGKVRGPFPPGQIAREILLGRIRGDDELSHDRQTWRALATLPQLQPEALRHVASEEGRQRLLLARLREDERGRERRGAGYTPEGAERRQGDRRNVESFEVVAHRERVASWAAEGETEERNLFVPAALVMSLIFILALYFFWYRPAAAPPARDCEAPPAPQINWNNCTLAGRGLAGVDLREARLGSSTLTRADLHDAKLAHADLSYANLEAADLHGAQLAAATLKGAVLRGANLAGADLRGGDLGYADLTGANLAGANLAGARLGRAIWLDGRVCAADSVGECR